MALRRHMDVISIVTYIGIVLAALAAIATVFTFIIMHWRPIYYSYSNKYNKFAPQANGEIVEITIKNYGSQPDTDIEIILSNNLTFKLLNDLPGIRKEENVIYINRISGSAISYILILIENSSFNKESFISVKSASKEIKFKEETPEHTPYWQALMIGIFWFALMFILPFFAYNIGKSDGEHEAKYGELSEKNKIDPERIKRIAYLESQGWLYHNDFFKNALFLEAYPHPSFPIKLVGSTKLKDKIEFTFETTNQLKEILDISIRGDCVFETKADIIKTDHASRLVKAGKSQRIILTLPLPGNGIDPEYLFKVILKTQNSSYIQL